MATLRTRLDRLEDSRGNGKAGPTIVFICDAETGEPGAALTLGGGSLSRNPDEPADAFTARVNADHQTP